MKETEKRADRWREAFGVEQTEIDALATLRPNVLRDIVRQAFDPYVDRLLADRVARARVEWDQQAAAAINEQIDAGKALPRSTKKQWNVLPRWSTVSN